MNNNAFRHTFSTLFLQIAREIGAVGNFAPQLAQAQSPIDVCLELQKESTRLRFMHSSREEFESRALIEIVAGVAPDAQKEALYTSMLVLNAHAWPVAYSLDVDTEEVACSWPIALEDAVAADIGRAIEATLGRFDAWAEAGLVMSAMGRVPLHGAAAPHLTPANLRLEVPHG